MTLLLLSPLGWVAIALGVADLLILGCIYTLWRVVQIIVSEGRLTRQTLSQHLAGGHVSPPREYGDTGSLPRGPSV